MLKNKDFFWQFIKICVLLPFIIIHFDDKVPDKLNLYNYENRRFY